MVIKFLNITSLGYDEGGGGGGQKQADHGQESFNVPAAHTLPKDLKSRPPPPPTPTSLAPTSCNSVCSTAMILLCNALFSYCSCFMSS